MGGKETRLVLFYTQKCEITTVLDICHESAQGSSFIFPYLGFFHAIDYGRPSMALDLMEEFRPIVADSIVLEAVNRPFVSLVDFEEVDLSEKESERDEYTEPRASTHAVYLNADGREKMIVLYENRVNDEGMFHYQDQQVSYRYVFQFQAQAMARLILGEANEYVPFTVR